MSVGGYVWCVCMRACAGSVYGCMLFMVCEPFYECRSFNMSHLLTLATRHSE